MRFVAWLMMAVAASAPPAATGASRSTSGTLVAKASTGRANAQPAALSIRIEAPLRCGNPAGLPITVALPNAERVPHKIPASAVTVNGRPAGRVTVAGHKVTVRLPAPGTQCDVIAMGPITVVMTRLAGLGNPPHAGTYALLATRGPLTFRGALLIHK